MSTVLCPNWLHNVESFAILNCFKLIYSKCLYHFNFTVVIIYIYIYTSSYVKHFELPMCYINKLALLKLKSDEHLRRSRTKQRHLMPFHLLSAVMNNVMNNSWVKYNCPELFSSFIIIKSRLRTVCVCFLSLCSPWLSSSSCVLIFGYVPFPVFIVSLLVHLCPSVFVYLSRLVLITQALCLPVFPVRY